jgi:hypothetical protein
VKLSTIRTKLNQMCNEQLYLKKRTTKYDKSKNSYGAQQKKN